MNGVTGSIALDGHRQLRDLLRQALDPALVRNAISERLQLPAGALAVERVLFSASRPITIHYRLPVGDSERSTVLIGELTGEATARHLDDERLRLRKSRRGQLAAGDARSLFAIPDPGLVLRKPGLDSRLDGLRLAFDRPLAAQVIGSSLGEDIDPAALSVDLKAHRLGKRAVLMATLNSAPRCFIRLRPIENSCGEAGFSRHRKIVTDLDDAIAVRVPEAHGFNAQWGAAIFAVLEGRPPQLSGPSAESDGWVSGQALREFRERVRLPSPFWTAADELRGLRQWAARLDLLDAPEVSRAFTAALRGLEVELAALPAIAPEACHRDVHEGQLLIAGRRCGLLDFDTVCLSDPALDIGNLLAHLRLWELRSGVSAGRFRRAFLDAAQDGRERIMMSRIDAWTRAALLRLAAIYAFTSEAPRTVTALIGEAAP